MGGNEGGAKFGGGDGEESRARGEVLGCFGGWWGWNTGDEDRQSQPCLCSQAEGLDLLQKMLQFHPKKRITVEAALTHPYLCPSLASPDEPVCPRQFQFNEEGDELDEKTLKQLIFKEICECHPDNKQEKR